MDLGDRFGAFGGPGGYDQGMLLDPLAPMATKRELASALVATRVQYERDGPMLLLPELLGRFGICYPEDFAEGKGTSYETVAHFLAFLNSPYIPPDERVAARAGRRWAQRGGIEELLEPGVRFLVLRRSAHAEDTQAVAGREYSHRWLVSGHFRNQRYPSEQTHRVMLDRAPHEGPGALPATGTGQSKTPPMWLRQGSLRGLRHIGYRACPISQPYGGPSSLPELLEQRLSFERLRPYRVEVGGGLDDALRLYEWNAATSGAFFEVLGHMEVLLRNCLHQQLTAWHAATGRPGWWYDDPRRLLDERTRADISKARQTLAANHQVEVPGKVVAELNFGFWRFLLDKRYQATLWAPCLQHAFPQLRPRRRAEVSTPISNLHRLRNRIAHHEPIHGLPLADRHEELLRVAGFIDPGIRGWLSALSRVPALLASRPVATQQPPRFPSPRDLALGAAGSPLLASIPQGLLAGPEDTGPAAGPRRRRGTIHWALPREGAAPEHLRPRGKCRPQEQPFERGEGTGRRREG